ncbi:MAG: hypothetical protein IKN04_17050 [Clostridia bacterium]|nr:hypothetical protein [Clostridia bacterium]
MVKRFLLYSLRHGCPVKALFAGTMKYQNIRVDSLDESCVSYHTAGRKAPVTVEISAILSVSYARGDDGDTLKYAAIPQEEKPT